MQEKFMQLPQNAKRLPWSVALALVLLALSAGWAQAQDGRPNCYILSAGVDNYPNANRLSGCLHDARNTTAAFQSQQGVVFGKVFSETLLDKTATRGNILQKFQNLAGKGVAGDFGVLFLSGHGSRTNNNQTWYFLPFDFHPKNMAGTIVTDSQILDAADGLVQKGMKVLIIVDACFAGQLQTTAQSYFKRYKNPQEGGLILMLSSSANQVSAALGDYSAFARAFADALTAKGDLNQDGRITLQEVRHYSYQRTYQLLKQRGLKDKQDSLVVWSPSIFDNLVLARTPKQLAALSSQLVKAGDGLKIEGELAATDDTDQVLKNSFCKVYLVKMDKNKKYVIRMNAANMNVLDTVLRVEDADGRQLAINDDAPGENTLNSRIDFSPNADGIYRVIATSLNGKSTGGYTLLIKLAE